MKRIFSPRRVLAFLLAVCLMLPVTACNGIMGEVEQKNDELVIWKQFTGLLLGKTFVGFQALHPDVTVKIEDYTSMDAAEFNQKLSTEILAGRGPDIIIMDFTLQRTASAEKMMRSGVFADMSEYFTDFNWNDYVEPVMDKGVVDGKRVLFPIQYTMPVLLTSQSILEETGFDPDNCTDYVSFLQEYKHFQETQPDNSRTLFDYPFTLEPFFCGIGNLSWANYNKKTVDFSSPALQGAVEAYRLLYKEEQTTDTVDGTTIKVGVERSKPSIFSTYFAANYQNYWLQEFLGDICRINVEDEAIFIPIRNKDGGISVHIKEAVGVRNNSANKGLAAELIQYLLSSGQQSSSLRFYWPVLTESLHQKINSFKKGGSIIAMNSNGSSTILSLTDEEADAIYALTEEIDSAYFRSPYDAEFYDAFRPYWEGKSSYEDCAAAFEKRAQIFISE